MFQESLLYNLFENGTQTGIILGDSGYACKNWLLPPFRENQIRGCHKRENYNREQKRARCIIERAFGQLKRRWGCLHGEIRFTPEKACKVIIAACALHNLAKDLSMPENEAQNYILKETLKNCKKINQGIKFWVLIRNIIV